jgi:8-amino-7-oxononanoate synthase
MKKVYNHIHQKLDQRKVENAFRELKVNSGLIDFCSNDYLGFASEKEIHLVTETLPNYGATGSRLISGNNKITEELEQFIAEFHNAEAGLIFNSGFTANLGLFSCLPQRNDTIIYDELIHASIRDGVRLSRANVFSFKHNDIKSLEDKLKCAQGNVYVAVESVYSMDGDVAPLKEVVSVCNNYDAALIVDEAHAVGVFGSNGEGLVTQLGLENDVFARIVTFGKALGCHGAIVLGDKSLRDYLINYSRAFIYTTALPLMSISTIKNAYSVLRNSIHRREKLIELINHFKNKIQHSDLNIIESVSAIQCIIIPGNDAVKSLAKHIQNNGFDVRPILSPTVPKGFERLRICIHSFNTKEELDKLIKLLQIKG